MDRAYYDFLAEHPGVQVARIDGANADILGDMLRQSPDTDIYLLDGNDSVSYTHLDVYKRQVQGAVFFT